MRVRVLLLFALAGTDFRPFGSVKTLCTYHVHCTRRRAALRAYARRWGATEREPSRAKKTCSAWHMQIISESKRIDHSPYIVDFRSAGWLPYVFKYRHALRAKKTGSLVCFFRMAPVWTASALDSWQIRYSAPKMEGIINRSAHRR